MCVSYFPTASFSHKLPVRRNVWDMTNENKDSSAWIYSMYKVTAEARSLSFSFFFSMS